MGAREADRSTRGKQMTSPVYVDSDTNVFKGADLQHLFTRGRRAEISHYPTRNITSITSALPNFSFSSEWTSDSRSLAKTHITFCDRNIINVVEQAH